jgi:DNA processing protein
MNELQMKIALTMIPQMGPKLVRRLVSYAGSIEEVFKEKKKFLEKIPGIGEIRASLFDVQKLLPEAEKELCYIRKEGITPLFYLDKDYPLRLRECEDAPVMLYVKGPADFNVPKVISIVGTRNASEYGKSCTEEVVSHLAAQYPDLLIVSGLAYGIDITAHKAALKNNLKTVAVLGHGLRYIYPALHGNYAKRIITEGALITEFHSECKPEAGNFVSRNRIIAGLADATLIVESAVKGGALITADLASSYNRDVFALPGRSVDKFSGGCNSLIKQNKAALIETGYDIEYAMGWDHEKKKSDPLQKLLFIQLKPEEEKIIRFLQGKTDQHLDEISISLGIPVALVSAMLLNLEFNGLIKSLPGKYYRKI